MMVLMKVDATSKEVHELIINIVVQVINMNHSFARCFMCFEVDMSKDKHMK
jgi:hypothetical protein